jgi:hypothetical protein
MASSGAVSFKIDSVAPDLTYIIPPVDGQQGWFLSAPMVSVSGSDATSGLAAAEIQVDGGNWQSGSMPVTADGVHTVNFRARDNAGNSKSANATVQVDRTAPAVNATIEGTQGQNGWYRSAVRFTPVGSDAASGISTLEAQIGNGPWQTGFPLTLQEGRNNVTVRATDKAGNLTTIPQSILIDVTPPVLTISVPQPGGQNGWFITAPVVKVTGTDVISGISSAEMRVDGGDWIADGETIEQNGVHTIEFQAQDIAGNVTSQSASIKVDLQGPAIELHTEGTAGQNNWFTSPQVKITSKITDLLSGVSQTEFRVDGGSWQTGLETLVQGDGNHQVVVRSTDLAGNISTRTQTVQIDSTAPVVDVNVDALTGLNGWYRSNANVKADVMDPVSGWEETAIRVDGGEWQKASSVKLALDGVYQLDVQAKDKAGNQASLSRVVKIDQHDPIGYIAEPQGGTRVKGTVQVGGVVHDEMSGMGNIDLSLDEGKTWQKIPAKLDGSWSSSWDTTKTSGGMHNLQVRFTDLAGNTSTGKLFITVANNSLSLHLTERWYIWDSGLLEVIPGDIDIISVSIEVVDPLGRWPAEHLEYHQGQQQEVSWDRYFGDILAPVGEYMVRVKVVDVLAQESEVQGVIVIPPAATPTVTSTALPTKNTPTATVRPTSSATPIPTSTQVRLIPTQVITQQTPTMPETKPADHQIPFVYWSLALVTIGFLFILATTSLTDRRPQELRKLTKWIKDQGSR